MHMASSTTTTALLADHRHQLLHDFTPASASSQPLRSQPRAAHAPAAARRVASNKRRPRPSRRLPTTYISADAASFRRMVHQLTGAAHDDLPVPQQPAADDKILSRPAPVRAAPAGGSGVNALLPTLDTSAFLAGALSRSCDASPPALEVEGSVGVGGACCYSTGSGGFPTLESWEHALF